jgi:non-ribosomal peptide synthetase component F
LIAGGTIVIPDHEHYKNPQHWYDMMITHHVTIWNSVPMLMQMLVEYLQQTYNPNQLRHILLSGDWIPLSLPSSIQTTFGEKITITSLGGATEASIWSIAFTLPKQIPYEWKSIPYGTPLRNQQYYVYDTHLVDCPEWVNGELYIGGVGLADGYWNDQEKTASSFIIHPHTGERLYRTGDQGRFVPDGYIEFLGRKDFQVKVHGHRIELGEIEYHLQQHSDIHQAIVTLDQNSQRLIGYIMPETHSGHDDDYYQSEIEITDPIERTNFKLARHGIRHQDEGKETFSLIKPKLTEQLINTYYARKS